MSQDSINQMVFKILGSGCKKCNLLEEHVQQACQDEGLVIAIEHERDFAKIASYGVMSTPALVLNEKVVSSGKVLTVDEVKQIIREKIYDAKA
ncbi:thioredoxin family protein [Streptococcus porci]|uniref:thioredoxin family protein n=1 Tax=Streptococcus porci TaxID=502567 RepID=UPI00041AD1FC|nr:thioredoxin family protein [Streptococcus porci]